MQTLIESVLFNKSNISKYLKENNSGDLVNKLCMMLYLYESCMSDDESDRIEYVEKHFPIVYETTSNYKMYESKLTSIISKLSEEDGGIAPTNVAAGIDAATPRIYTKKNRVKKVE